jgi:hypothetical protein
MSTYTRVFNSERSLNVGVPGQVGGGGLGWCVAACIVGSRLLIIGALVKFDTCSNGGKNFDGVAATRPSRIY